MVAFDNIWNSCRFTVSKDFRKKKEKDLVVKCFTALGVGIWCAHSDCSGGRVANPFSARYNSIVTMRLSLGHERRQLRRTPVVFLYSGTFLCVCVCISTIASLYIRSRWGMPDAFVFIELLAWTGSAKTRIHHRRSPGTNNHTRHSTGNTFSVSFPLFEWLRSFATLHDHHLFSPYRAECVCVCLYLFRHPPILTCSWLRSERPNKWNVTVDCYWPAIVERWMRGSFVQLEKPLFPLLPFPLKRKWVG